MKNGTFWPNPASWTLPEPIWRPYFEALARMVGGTVIDEPNNKYVAVHGRSGPRIEQLLPNHQDAWVTAIDCVIRAANPNAALPLIERATSRDRGCPYL